MSNRIFNMRFHRHTLCCLLQHKTGVHTRGIAYLGHTSSNIDSRYRSFKQQKFKIHSSISLAQQNNSEPISEKALALAKLEYEACKLDGVIEIPSQLTPEEWEEMACLKSTHSRRDYLRFLFLNQMRAANRAKQKEIKAEHGLALNKERAQQLQEYKDGKRHIVYGLWVNSIFHKVNIKQTNNFYNGQLMNAKLYGQPIVFDADYSHQMSRREAKSAADQFSLLFGLNRLYKDPYYIHLCNYNNPDTLSRAIPTLQAPEFPIDIHKGSYLDIFPKESLVYLTPDCKEDLIDYDNNAVYIIGYIVDKGPAKSLTLAKAKKEGIKTRRLPLDRFLDWGQGTKFLTLNQVMGILLEVKSTGSWIKAFEKYIPKRKLIKSYPNDAKQLKQKMSRTKQRSRINFDADFLFK